MRAPDSAAVSIQSNQDNQEIKRALAKILASNSFRNARRSRDFLAYVTTATLTHKINTIKEYHIALDVFGKKDSFDPSSDSIVRVEASRLRSKLKEYYNTEGKYDDCVIELPKGCYLPKLRSLNMMSSRAESSGDPSVDVAVLPFLSLDKDVQTGNLADAITEDLIDTLAGFDGIYVAPRTSVFRFKYEPEDVLIIAKKLGVTILLEGSVRRNNTAFRVKVRVINTLIGSNRQLCTYHLQLYDDRHGVDDFCAQAARALVVGLKAQPTRP